jgi:tRNA-dihydrouridine synthase C
MARRAIQGMQVMDATHASAAALSLDWYSLFPLIQDFWDLVGRRLDKKSRTGRLKQWLNFLRRSYPEAEAAYQALRIYNEPERVDAWLASEQLARQLQIVRP